MNAEMIYRNAMKRHMIVEAMTSKIILMMSKNQELSKFQRIKNQKASRIKIQDSIKFQESRFKNNQDQDSRLKIQESREDLIKISTKKVFQNID